MSIKTVAVLGAGHGGCAAAADLGRRGYGVRLHARSAERLGPLRERGGIEARGVVTGVVPVDLITTDLGAAVRGADLIMLVVPSVAHAPYARALAPLIADGQPLFLNPGHTGGGLHFLHELRRAGYRGRVASCETVTLTYITRMEGPATVNIYSYTTRLRFAALPGRNAEAMFALIKPLYPNIVQATSVLETGLGNINAIFHPPGMIMNAGWIERRRGDFLFYREGITQAVGRVTAAVDAERVAVAKALGVPALPFLDIFHEAGLTTAAARESRDIARACEESEPNRTIKAPPSLDHRYIHEDVGYGLVPMAELGRLAGVATPTIDSLITLAGLALGIDYRASGLTLERLGLAGKSPSELTQFVETC
jgi:opine dehydrogenase